MKLFHLLARSASASVLLATLVTSCAGQPGIQGVPSSPSPETSAAIEADGAVQEKTDDSAPSEGKPSSPPATFWTERKLIRTATLTLEVVSVEDTLQKTRQLTQTYGGFLADAQVTRNDNGDHNGTLTVRVPSNNFDRAIAAFKDLGLLKQESINTEDITKAYTDLETRLRVKEQTQKRLREILENRTGALSDILAVEQELERVVTEIEVLKGERRYYDQQVAVSTLTLSLTEPAPFLQVEAFSPIREAWRSSQRVFSTSVAAIIYLVVVLIPWAIAAFLLWQAIRLWGRFRRQRKSALLTTPVPLTTNESLEPQDSTGDRES